MKYEIDVDTHHAVGPLALYDHELVTTIYSKDEDGNTDPLYVCLECGYTAHDSRLFNFEACDREDNPISQSWREAGAEFPSVDE